MSRNSFDYLSGTVRIAAPRHPDLADSLVPFYEGPNDERWAADLCRVLYHESVHFWQFLASAYLGNVFGGEWRRAELFKRSGELEPRAAALLDFRRRVGGAPFSAYELSECWARFWDVHTRGPVAILLEEDTELPPHLEHIRELPPDAPYPGPTYDLVMQTGTHHSEYAAPFRWIMARMRAADWVRRRGGGGPGLDDLVSYLVQVTFPALVHGSFGSPDPVRVALAAYDRLAGDEDVGKELLDHRVGSINLAWVQGWTFCRGEIVEPTLGELRLPAFTSGVDVIQRGTLRDHPVFSTYLERMDILQGHLKLRRISFEQSVPDHQRDYLNAMTLVPLQDPWAPFGMPGQPDYRVLLGQAVPPPGVVFTDATTHVRQSVLEKAALATGRLDAPGPTPEERLAEVEATIRGLRDAEYAQRVGLPVGAFA